jgi:hypothetical protein
MQIRTDMALLDSRQDNGLARALQFGIGTVVRAKAPMALEFSW